MQPDRSWRLVEEAQEACRQRILEDRGGATPDVAAILEAIEPRLFDPGFTVTAVKDASGATPTAAQHFNQQTAANIKNYATDRLLEVAAELLDDVRVDLRVIPVAVGLRTNGALRRWYRRWKGENPATRRQRAIHQAMHWPDLDIWIRAQVGALRPEEAARLVRVCEDCVAPEPAG